MKERAGKKKVVLELGGNAGAIVDASADLDWAVKRVLMGGFAYSGQVCISVQRLYVHASIWDEFMDRFVAAAAALKMGDPLDDTDIGPMVDAAASSAPSAGWTTRWPTAPRCWPVARGGPFFPPTVIVDVPRSVAGLLRGGLRAGRGGLPVR